VGAKHPVACAVLLFLLHYLSPTGGGLLAGAGAIICGATLDRPVEDVVVLEALTNKQVTEELAKVRVIRLVIEAKSTSVVQEDAEFAREATAKNIGGCSHLLFHDSVILLLLGSGLESLPREGATQEVHEYVCERLEVVTTGLLNTQVSVDRGVASGTGQVLILPVWDVQVGLRVTEFLRETKVDDVNLIATFANAHQEVVGLNVTVYEVAGVDVLDTGDELVSEKQDGLEGEFAVAEIEEVLERRAKKVQDHRIVVTLSAKPPYEGNADAAGEGLVDLGLVLELGVLGFDGFKFDGDLFTRDDIDPKVNIAERA